MIVDQNGRDHFGRPQALSPCVSDQACPKEGSGGSLWPSRGRSVCPSLDTRKAIETGLTIVWELRPAVSGEGEGARCGPCLL